MEPSDDSARLTIAEQPALLPYALLLLAQLFFAAQLQTASVPYGLIVSEVLFFGAPTWMWLAAKNFPVRDFLGLRLPSWKLIALGAALGAANFLVAGTLQVLVRRLMSPELLKLFDISHIFAGAGPFELGTLLVALSVAAPICEEMLFRGYLQTVFGARLGMRAGIVVSAVLFALLHFDPVGMLARIELGVLFGALVFWSRSLWPAVAAHAVNNLIASILFIVSLGSGGSQPQAEPALGPTLAGGLVALLATAGLLAAFRRLAGAAPSTGGSYTSLARPGADHSFRASRARAPALFAMAFFAASTAIFLALDWRGAEANFIDEATPTSKILDRVPDQAERKDLEERLRQAHRLARQGKLGLDQYRQLRTELFGTAEQRKEKVPLDPASIARALEAASPALGGSGG